MLILTILNIALCLVTIVAISFNWSGRVFELLVDAYVFPTIFLLVLATYPISMYKVSFTVHTNVWMQFLIPAYRQGLIPFVFYQSIILLTTL